MQIEDYGHIIEKAFTKLELTNITLIGHSFGGRISLYLSSYSQNIKKLILIGSAGISYPQSFPRNFFVKS